MNVYLPGGRLPSAYQEVEYIQSDRSVGQYIHTSIIATDSTGLYLKVSSQNVSNDSIYLGSNDNNTDSGSKKFGLGNATGANYFGFNEWLPVKSSGQRPPISANTIVELENNFMNSRLMKKDGVTVYTITSTLTSNGYGLNIFGHNGGGTAQYFSSIKLYNLKVSNGSSVAYNFVPCYRKSDNVIGLYDLVNNQFYTNSGSGTFSKGNDVTMAVLKNAYIGEYIEETYTISKASSSSSSYSTNNISIYKSGYKITNILIEASGKSLNTSQSGVLGLNISNASSGHTECIQVYTSVGNSTSGKLEYQHSGSWTTVSSSIGTISGSGTNNYSLNITSEGVVTTIINGTTNTFTLTGNGKLALDSILSGSSIYSEIYSRYGEIGPATVTVTYEPNS